MADRQRCAVRRIFIPGRAGRCLVGVLALGLSLVPAAPAGSATRAGTIDWPAYLLGPTHPSFNKAATAIAPANASTLAPVWTWIPDPPTMRGQPGRRLYSSPTVYAGHIYIGADTGVVYALDEASGQVTWQQFLGFVTEKTCGKRGITSTATVALDPVTGLPTVYVAAADGYLYAIDAADGTIRWRSLVVNVGDTQNEGVQLGLADGVRGPGLHGSQLPVRQPPSSAEG